MLSRVRPESCIAKHNKLLTVHSSLLIYTEGGLTLFGLGGEGGGGGSARADFEHNNFLLILQQRHQT